MTDKIRGEVMKKFLRTLIWIDDEIRPDKTDLSGHPFRSFFYPTARHFQKKELLVHLQPYEAKTSNEGDNIFDEDSESLDSAVALAKKADVIILDWHLGLDRPTNSIKLLKRLNQESAIRYVIVLSKFAGNFEDEMIEADMVAQEASGSVEPAAFKRIGDAWANSHGTHVIVMSKPKVEAYSAEGFSQEVIDAIFKLMSRGTPDYLHWAAIEIAAKLRHSIPAWVQSLPRETDTAVLSELISDDAEARSFIPEHLLEDLSHLAKLHSLDSLDSKNCNPKDWTNNPQVGESGSCGAEPDKHHDFIRFKTSIAKVNEDAIFKMRKAGDESCSKFIKSQELFAQFCESISRHVDESPSFGAVYEQSQAPSPGETSKIFICVSQECDCLRGFNLLFLKGKVTKPGPSKFGATKLLFQGKEYEFTARAEDLKTCPVETNRTVRGMKKIGQLREATARRILSRFWNHFSRSAVNLPTFARTERAENKVTRNKDEDSN